MKNNNSQATNHTNTNPPTNKDTCYGCNGSGDDDMDATMYCPVCNGTGAVEGMLR